jgi:hypothetical protein
MRIINWFLAFPMSAYSSNIVEGRTYPIPDPIIFIVARTAVHNGL